MSKKSKKNQLKKDQRNPPFDRRILNMPGIAGVDAEVFKRGRIESMNLDHPKKAGWTVHFLYNPSAIAVNHGLATGVDLSQPNPNAVGNYFGSLTSTLAFSLLFDRTYELWDKSLAKTDAGTYGVYVDIRALYGLTGIVKQRPLSGFDLPISPLQNKPCQVYFGKAKSLSYYGYITSLNVTYSNWTQRMVPMRAGVEISFTILPASGPYSSSYAGKFDGGSGREGKGGGWVHGGTHSSVPKNTQSKSSIITQHEKDQATRAKADADAAKKRRAAGGHRAEGASTAHI